MKNGQKLKLGDADITPRIYSRSTSVKAWGCPRHPLFHQQKYQVLFQYTIFIASYTMCCSWSVFVFGRVDHQASSEIRPPGYTPVGISPSYIQEVQALKL